MRATVIQTGQCGGRGKRGEGLGVGVPAVLQGCGGIPRVLKGVRVGAKEVDDLFKRNCLGVRHFPLLDAEDEVTFVMQFRTFKEDVPRGFRCRVAEATGRGRFTRFIYE